LADGVDVRFAPKGASLTLLSILVRDGSRGRFCQRQTGALQSGRGRSWDKEQVVMIRGDKNVKWDPVAKIMTACAQAQITKVSATVEVQE
jgi:hypothetical protein